MKKALWILGGLLALVILIAAAGWLVLRTDWFREKLRQRAVQEAEKATGGRVDIGAIHFDPRRWFARIDQFTIRGSEPATEKPLFHADTIEVTLRVVSFFKRDIDVAAVKVYRPEIHIAVGPGGATNFPSPAKKRTPSRVFTETFVDLAIGQLELQDGTVWWDDQRYSIAVAVSNLRLQLDYPPPGLYDGRMTAGRTSIASALRMPDFDRVNARFRVMRDRIEFIETNAGTPTSQIRASGFLVDLRQPRWHFQYDAKIDARELAAAIPIQELRAGRIHAQGTFDSGAGEWSAAGKVAGQELAVSSKEYRFRDLAMTGNYSARRKGATVEGLDVRLLGGQWKGRLSTDYKQMQLEGRLEAVSLEEINAAIATPSRPLDRLGWSASVSGPLRTQTTVPIRIRDTSVQGEVTLSPPGPGVQGIPVQGVAKAAYRGRGSELQLDDVRLATPATSVIAAGRLSEKGDTNIQFRVRTTRIEELTGAAFAVTAKKIEFPVRVNGRMAAQGLVLGTLDRPQLNTALEVTKFVQEGREWDSLTGRVQWSKQYVRLIGGKLVKGKALIGVNARAQLDDGRFTETSPFQADVSARDTAVQDLAALAGRQIPATGTVNASFKVEGTQKDPRGAGSIELRGGTAWNEPFDSLRATVALEQREIRASNVRLTKGKGVVTGSGVFNPDRRTFRADARGDRLTLSDFQRIASTGRKITGIASFTAAGSGRLDASNALPEQLSAQGKFQVRDIAVDEKKMGDITASARTAGEKIQMDLQSNFLAANISGKGEMTLRDRYPMEARIEFTGIDLPAALAAAGFSRSGVEGSAAGFMTVQGEARRPESIVAQGSLTKLEVGSRVGTTTRPRMLQNAEPVTWRITNQRLTLESLHLTGEGSDIRSSGTVELGGNQAIKLAVNGNLNLAIVSTLDSRIETGGFATLTVDIGGTRPQPDMTGKIEIREASLSVEDFPLGLSGGAGAIVFSKQRITIQKITAQAGGGDVIFSGDADITRQLTTYRLRSELSHVRLRYPAGLSNVLDGALNLSGTNQRSRLEGKIEITRLGTRPSVDLATILAGLKQPPRTPSSNEWLQGAQLDVTIVSAPDIRFETSIARDLQAEVNLRLRGTVLNPALLGRVNITQGELEFQGTRFVVNRGDISFANPFRIEPILNLDLETRVSGYDIVLTLVGPLQKLNITYRSDPPLTFNEVITLLAVGRAPTTDPTLVAQQSIQARSLTELGASTVIGQAIARPVSGRLQRFFGVSRLKVDPELTGPEGNPNARITLEQQVGKDITFTYTYNLASAQEQIIRMQWAINRQLSLVLVRDQNGLFGIDFFYKRRYR